MKNHIIEGIERIDLISHPKIILKLNSDFKKMGFKAVKYNSTLNLDTYESDLTLYIKPQTRGTIRCNYVGIYDTSDLYEFTKVMEGYMGIDGYNKILDDNKTPINIKIKEREYEIGCYLKNRNIVVLYLPIFYSNFNLPDNKYCFYFVDFLKKWISENKLEKVDTKKIIKELMVENFIKEAKIRVDKNIDIISQNENHIIRWNLEIVSIYKNTMILNAENIALKELIDNAKKIVFKQIDLIKELPFVNSVRLTNKGVSVDVGDISIRYKGHDIKIGKFQIYLKPGSIELENKTPLKLENEGRTIHHPHINRPDSFCLGSRTSKVYEMLSKYELKKLVYFLYLFLKSYNPDDKMNDIKYWADAQKIELDPKKPESNEVNNESELDDGGSDENERS